MNDISLRREIIRAAKSFNPTGLSTGTSGNLSARTGRGFLLTPTGVDYQDLVPETLVELDLDGKRISGSLNPSSEWQLHREIYQQRPEIDAVVHTHSTYATALACNRMAIPAFHYHVARAGGDSIRCADYATFGSRMLAENALRALEGRTACLLANHGQLALGISVAAALYLAREVEELARQYCIARQVGEPVLLNESEMQINLDKFRTYGKQGD